MFDPKRLAEVREAAQKAAPSHDGPACAAALLVIVFDAQVRAYMKSHQPRLWEQILAALGPLVPPVREEQIRAALGPLVPPVRELVREED